MNIKLGYEIGTGKQVDITPSHVLVTGITQLSGKTTTLEGLIKRSQLKAIVFKTKIGEKSFTTGNPTKPFFRDRSDYDFVKSLIEAYSKEKLVIEKGTLMQLCKGSKDLIEIKRRIDNKLSEEKLRGLKEEIHIRLQHYLENLIPQIQYGNLSHTLDINEGINVMDLDRYTEEAQSLIIESVGSEVLTKEKNTIIVIPEAWKFIPQKYNNPCKRVVESFIRQGAANNNFIWIDSQDMANVDKGALKQISTWILGVQSERNEVKHTLDQIPLPKSQKPSVDEIMSLGTGVFYLATREKTVKVYVQPAWLDDEEAKKIAKGELKISNIKKPTPTASPTTFKQLSEQQFSSPTSPPAQLQPQLQPQQTQQTNTDSKLQNEIIELRQDFFKKITEQQTHLNKIGMEVIELKQNNSQINEEQIISKILLKIPLTQNIDEETIIKKILGRIPTTGNVVYEVTPLEKIKKDFLETAKQKIIQDTQNLSKESKQMLKYLESRGVGISVNEIAIKCFLKPHGANPYNKFVNDCGKELATSLVAKKQTNGKWLGMLKDRIKELTQVHDATEQEIENLYQHIIMEIIK